MARMQAVMTTRYEFDPQKSTEENLNEIFDNIRKMVGEDNGVVIEIHAPMNGDVFEDVNQFTDAVERCVKEAEEAEKRVLVPVSVDNSGEVLYKRKENEDKKNDK